MKKGNNIKLTPYQAIFYYEWLQDPQRSDYNIVIDFTVSGELDIEKNKASLNKILDEHLLLKSNVINTEDGLFWKYREESSEVISYYDYKLTDKEIYELVAKPFDLEKDLLLRYLIIKLEDSKYRILYITPHILVDGISTHEVYGKLTSNYNNNGNDTYIVPSLATQAELHEKLTAYFENILLTNKQSIHDFWEKHLKGINNVDLTFLKKTNKLRNNPYRLVDEYKFSYKDAAYTQLKSLRNKYKITPYIFGQAILSILLHKISGNDNIGIAYPIAVLEGKELIYGAHVNTMIIDYRFDKETTLQTLIEQAHNFYKDIKSSKAKYLPINEIAKYAENAGVLDIAFAQTFLRDMAIGFDGLGDEKANHEFQIDLSNKLLFEQEDHDGSLNYRIRFDNDLLDKELVHRFILLYKKLFEEVLSDLLQDNSQKKITDIELLDEAQHKTIISDWNLEKNLQLIEGANAISKFEEIAKKRPDNTAIVFQNKKLSYNQVNEQANILGAFLREKYKIQPDDLIALCMDKSELLPISILAILKTGGAYVPIDTDAPDDRIVFIAEDTRAKVILTNSSHKQRLTDLLKHISVNIISIDDESLLSQLETQYLKTNLEVAIQQHNLAYVIYTSGTTGKPKGVMLEHIGLSNLISSQGKIFGLEYDPEIPKRCLWYASYIFDAHISELFTAIANGHELYILEEEKRYDFQDLDNYINQNHIELATVPPVLLEKNRLLNLSTIVMAGDVTNPEIMNNYYTKGVTVINAYGPTETTVCATTHYYKNGDSNTNIGRPLCNYTTYILDSNLQPVPVGVPGELYIGGAGVARGYLNNAELTADQFIINPFVSKEDKTNNYNTRIYKTGDLVRYLPGGDIEYIGRNDFQVKIRGFRIELGEIETRLSEYPGIEQVTVIVKENTANTKSLIAYYVSDNELDTEAIRLYLEANLPDYMIPAAFVHLTAFPMTTNGKLDRKALPEPQFSNENNYVAPKNNIEKLLCKIYAQVLGLDEAKISVEDDFFRLGGDSISGIQLVSKMRQQMKVQLSIKDIFSFRTIKLLSKKIISSTSDVSSIKTEQGLLEGQVGLLPIQKWFFNNIDKKIFPDYNHWNQTFMLDVPQLDIEILKLSIQKLVEHHDAFRLTYNKSTNNSYTQYYQKYINEEIPFSQVHIAKLSDPEELNTILNSWQTHFDIFDGPLFHIGYLEGYANNVAKLHFAIHHLIVDAVSWHVIKNDLQAIYSYLRERKDAEETTDISSESILGAKNSSYRQWVETIAEYPKRENVQEETVYWKNILQDISDNNSLIKTKSVDKQNRLNKVVNKTYTQKLLRDIHHVYGTQVNDILLSALSSALTKLTGSDKTYITLEGHGRETISENIDINNTVGWFTSMYPIQLDSSNNDIDMLVVSTKDIFKRIPNNGLGYGALLGYTDHELPATGFNYLGQFDGDNNSQWSFSSEFSGLPISPKNQETNILNVNCGIINNELHIVTSGYLSSDNLSDFTDYYIDSLKNIIDTLSLKTRSYLTMSDTNYLVSEACLKHIQLDKEIESIYLANSLQQGFIYHALHQGDVDDAYRTQMLWDYHNTLNLDLLKQAWSLTQQKYPTLRLRFSWEEELIQIIDKQGTLDWNIIDISDLTSDKQESFVNDLLKEDRSKVYDLSAGSLFRVYIIKRNDKFYNCIFSNHHAILDGWSNPILIKYIHETYLDLLKGISVAIEADKSYPMAQKYLQNNQTENLQYWTNYLQQLESQEDLSNILAADKKNINLSEYKFIKEWKDQKLTISGENYKQLKEFSTTYGVTVNALFQYCWHKELSIFTASDETIVGMVVSGRNLPVEDIETSVGLYINTLPIVLKHDSKSTFIEAITGLQNNINESNGRSNVNLAQLQSSGVRLFNSLFVFENYPMPEGSLDEELSITFKGAKEKQDYPLVVTIFEQTEQIIFNLQYAGELFDESAIIQIIDSMIILLTRIMNNPENKIDSINFLSSTDYHKIIFDWNKTQIPYNADKATSVLFEEQVEKTPDNIALRYENIELTYRELNNRSNKLAVYLKKKYDIRRDDKIGLYLNRSENIVITILAVLKAGGAYVPIEPGMPEERISYILSDTKAKVLLIDNMFEEKLKTSNIPLESVDQEKFWRDLESYPTDNLPAVPSDNLAYIMYTSGTTGKPKGVMIEHRNINSLVVNANFVTVVPTDSFLNLSGYQFDGSTYDFYMALLNGASLTISAKDVFLDLKNFDSLIEKNKITNFFITTALFNTIVDAELSNLKNLKYIVFGGESASAMHVNKFLEKYSDVKLIHAYGPTETTTFATCYLTNETKSPFINTVSIGYPRSNTKVYILDNNMQPVPVNAMGELYIGGGGVSRGYLNNEQQTNEKFIPNPFQTEEEKESGFNDILYKTGDIARYLSSGLIEYIRRNDFQVKIRGFRIELGEIESRINELPDIRQSVVLALEHANGTKFLVAYYVSDKVIDDSVLRSYISSVLPDYMVPSAFIHLEELPLTINGKLDRRALPEPELTGQTDYVAPENEMQEKLRHIISEVLSISESEIGIDDDFFKLGGNSILFIKIAGRISKEFQRDIRISALFDNKTIRTLSAFIDKTDDRIEHITTMSVSRPEDQKLSFAQERLWFIESYEEGSNTYNIPMVFRLNTGVDIEVLKKAVYSVIGRHEVLRSLIKTDKNGIGYQEVTERIPTFEYQECVDMEDLDLSIFHSTNKIFDLQTELPIHLKIYVLNDDSYISIVIHHIAFDGWSTDLFINEVYNYYNYHKLLGEQRKEEALEYVLSPIKIQYKDFALWQRQYLQGDILQQQIDFWKANLNDYESLTLPTDRQRPQMIDYAGLDMEFVIDKKTSNNLREIAKNLNVSLYSVLLSGYYILLSAYSNQKDIIVGTPVAGRHYREIEDTIGFFVNNLVLRKQIDGKQSINEFIRQTGQMINQAQLHQDLPFEKLVEELSLEKDTSRSPLFQVMFGVQSFGNIEYSGLSDMMSLYQGSNNSYKYQVAKFDLTTILDDSKECITGLFNYATSLFNSSTIEEYISVYTHILQEIATADLKQTLVSKINYLPENDYKKIVFDWNKTRVHFHQEGKTIIDVFEDQVSDTPDNIAIVYKDIQLTYRELNERVNRLGAFLKERYKIQADDMIALCLGRSEYMLESMLAVMKAGAAYVPMDPSVPRDRLEYMMEQISTKVILTDKEWIESVKEISDKLKIDALVVNDISLREVISIYSEKNLNTDIKATDLAYVIYTSGTTGKPKGVMLEHKGFVNFNANFSNFTSLTKTDDNFDVKKVLFFANYVFDAHISDVYPTLTNGHCLYILEEEKRYDYQELSNYITKHQIEIALIAPAILQKDHLLDLSMLVLGGDVTNADIIHKYVSNGTKVINAYGPTEISVGSMMHVFEPNEINTNIGLPLKNITAYILNDELQPVPVGAFGELYIGGTGVSRGYLENPELTAERFTINPFQSESDRADNNYNARIYKTGDVVRYKSNGEIEYIGRNDFQVKIRGLRIELGEIESSINSYPGIQRSIVLANKHDNGTKYLVAYYASKDVNEDTIRTHLAANLPDYMVPSILVRLDVLPLNNSGKVDRKALPKPKFTGQDEYVAPQNEIQKQLCAIFAEILGLKDDKIGIEDDFFKLGGDSISSIQLVNKLRQSLNVHITIKDIFSCKTIKNLYTYILATKASESHIIIKSEQNILDGEAPLLPIQEWFFSNINKGLYKAYNHWNQSFIVKVPALQKNILELSLKKLIEYHDGFRLAFTKDHVQYYQKEIAELPIDYCNISNLKSENELNLLLTNWQNNFDIFNEKLFHIGYLDGYSDGNARLHFALHHLIIDAVSWRIIINDLQSIYQYFIKNEDSITQNIPADKILGKKGTSYRQWVDAITNYKKSDEEAYSAESDYWKSVVSGIVDTNEALSGLKTNQQSKTILSLDQNKTELLLRKIHHVYGTQINDVLLTALSLSLSKLTGLTDHHILLEGHGRENIFTDININNTLGWFTIMYPIKLSVENKNQEKVLTSVKNTLREIPNNGIGYGPLIGYTSMELPRISFNYLGQFDANDGNSTWTFCSENPGSSIADDNQDETLLSINGGIMDGKLQFSVSGYLETTILDKFAYEFRYNLETLIDTLVKKERNYLTRSDIDNLVSQDCLDQIQADKEIDGIYLANSLQQGFIYHAINQGSEDDAYHTQMMWDYHNKLDVAKMKQAWILTQQKYPTLRLRFSWDEELIQIIDKQGSINWEQVDISDKSIDEQDHFIKELLQIDKLQAFNLMGGNLFRAYLLKRDDNYYTCIFSSHHAIMDGWSGPIVIGHVHNAYLELTKGRQIPISEDYAYPQAQKYLQEHKLDNIEFWNNYLKLLESQEDLSSLLISEKRNINLSDYKLITNPSEISISIKDDQLRKIKDLCTHNGFTLNALFQYCWHKQLSIYGNSETTVIGMTISGRTLPIEDIEQSAGLYINTLPVILEHKKEKVIDLIKTLQDYINEINSRSSINLAQLHTEGTRLFNSLFVFENYPVTQNTNSNELVLDFKYSKEKLDYPLGITAFERNNEAVVKIQYAGELFLPETMQQLLDGMSLILDQVSDNEDIKSDELVLLDNSTYNQIITNWNKTYQPYPDNKTFIDAFEEQVDRTPDNIAIIYNDTLLTFKELNEKANLLGAYIKEKYQIKTNDLVALYLNRSEYMPIAILAVLKSGGAYVPMDPHAPQDRVYHMICDTKTRVIITENDLESTLNHSVINSDAQTLLIDEPMFMNNLKDVYSAENLNVAINSTDLAYIIYTSGTTGKPKGTMVEHKGLMNLATMQTDILGVKPCKKDAKQKRCLWYASYVFDAHAFELFPALTNGHRIYILEEDKRYNYQLLSNYIIDNEIELATIPPALLDKEQFLKLSTLVVAGDITDPEIMNNYSLEGIKVINAYGPTEDTVWSTWHNVNPGDSNKNIGRPIVNKSIYILNQDMQPVPVNAIGELYLGGIGVARGYLNNEELTKERFIANPFQSETEKALNYNNIIYKTGDLARYLPSGDIEFIGRNDFQVKIRGFRIELGEIESRINEINGIKQSIIIALEHTSGSKYLAAYYVSDEELNVEVIRQQLEIVLPDYMIPTTFVHLSEMPLNINGKIDRKALPKPEFIRQDKYAAPENEIQEKLCSIFSEVLGIGSDQISIDDDFFKLGGNSILFIKLAGKISKKFEKEVRISALFTNKTIRTLSQFMEGTEEQVIEISGQTPEDSHLRLLSFAQERLWFIDSFEGGSNAYNIPMIFHINKNVNIEVLESSILTVVQRHEVLRSFIRTNDEGNGYQEVVKLFPVIRHHNCSTQKEMNQLMNNAISRTFRLDSDLPIGIDVYTLAEEIYISIVIHHIAFDGWSTDLFIREVYSFYKYHTLMIDYNKDEAAKYLLPEIEVQYKNFALWQREYLSGEVLNKQLNFWKEYLNGYESLNMPTDKIRPPMIDYSGRDIPFSIDAETSLLLRNMAKDLNVTLYNLLLSGYYLFLSSFSNQQDIVLGTPVAGRHYQQIENTIGFFVNTLALRKQINQNDTISEFIIQTAESLNQVQIHQDLPFEKLVDELKVEKDTSRHPIFQVMFGLQSFGNVEQGEMSKLMNPYQISDQNLQYQVAKFELTTMMDDSEACIRGSFNYATALFNEATIHNYITVYTHILKQLPAAKAKGAKISQLSWMPETMYKQVVFDWNNTTTPFPEDKTIVDMFEQQVDKTPDNIAVVYKDVKLTYNELNHRANVLGAYLKETYNIQPDQMVALCIDRSEYMPEAILAIIKAGAAYVPMDTAAPEDRLRLMVEDTASKVIVTNLSNKEHLSKIFAGIHVDILAIDELSFRDKIATSYSGENLEKTITPSSLAYVIYTSGTTGKPKGAMIEHRSAINRIVWMQNEYPISEKDVILQKTTYTFDVSVWEIFWAHWHGASIVYADHVKYKDNTYLAQTIRDEKVTVMHFVPSVLIAFVEELENEADAKQNLASLRYLFCSGEALNLYEVLKFRELAPACKLYNLYGPTEATVDVLYYDCNNKNLSKVYIGKPIENTSAYILDNNKKPVPIGAIGELYIGGVNVGRGYLNNAELTAERFLPNPFQSVQEKAVGYNGRIYKTGDLALYAQDGNIEYVGRNDFQVKIRGLRIELGEIESCIAHYPGIRQAVVTTSGNDSSSKYLIGYYVSDNEIPEDNIRTHLAATLPDYMIPSVFVHLTTLPLSSNGKLNRGALPKPQLIDKQNYVAPETKDEILLCSIFAEVLNLNESAISIEDDFFKIGGNSILAMRLNHKINQLFNSRLRVMDILNAKTIRELAKLVGMTDNDKNINLIVDLNHAEGKDMIFMIHPGASGCEVYAPLAKSMSPHYHCYGIDSYNLYADNKIKDLSILADYYLSQIDKVKDPSAGYILLGWSLGGQIALEMAALLEKRGVKNIKAYLLDTWIIDDSHDTVLDNNSENIMDKYNIPLEERDRLKKVIDIDNILSVQPLSQKLQYTKVILFKATEYVPTVIHEKYPLNNIDNTLSSPLNLELVEIHSFHDQMLEQQQPIIDKIISV